MLSFECDEEVVSEALSGLRKDDLVSVLAAIAIHHTSQVALVDSIPVEVVDLRCQGARSNAIRGIDHPKNLDGLVRTQRSNVRLHDCYGTLSNLI